MDMYVHVHELRLHMGTEEKEEEVYIQPHEQEGEREP